jgi:hypothetical protein
MHRRRALVRETESSLSIGGRESGRPKENCPVAPLPLATCRIVMRCSSRYCDMQHASMPVAAINITRRSNLWAQGCSIHQDGEAGRPGSRDATHAYPCAVYSCGCGNANVRLWPCESLRAWPEGAYVRREMVVICIRTLSESDKCVFCRAVSPALVGRERDSAPGWLPRKRHSQPTRPKSDGENR